MDGPHYGAPCSTTFHTTTFSPAGSDFHTEGDSMKVTASRTAFALPPAMKSDDAPEPCHKCPHHSDVVLSSRWARYVPVNGLDTMAAIEAFHSTRLDWVYTTNASFVKQVHQRVATLTASMNPQCPDQIGRNATFNTGRVLNVHGQPLTDPAMRSWKNPPSFGCINHPDYLKIAFDFASELILIGADAIQHDDPGANGEVVSWSGGDPTLSGCYCEHCMAGFRDALLTRLNTTTQTRLNVSADFNYREVLLQGHQSASQMEELRALFVEFQTNSTTKYVRKLRVHVDATAATLGRPSVTLSCNNGGYWTMPAIPSLLFDYGTFSTHRQLRQLRQGCVPGTTVVATLESFPGFCRILSLPWNDYQFIIRSECTARMADRLIAE